MDSCRAVRPRRARAAALALGGACAISSVGAECIDYDDYLHWLSRADTPGYAHTVAISGAYAYVADHEGGLQIVDISDPASPQLASGLITPGGALGVAIRGTHALVADNLFGTQIIDITSPEKPQIVAGLDTPGEVLGVAVAGRHAHIADCEARLRVVDISNPAESDLRERCVLAGPRRRYGARGHPCLRRRLLVRTSDHRCHGSHESRDRAQPGPGELRYQRHRIGLPRLHRGRYEPCPARARAGVAVRFQTLVEGSVRVALYDTSGRLIRELFAAALPAGDHDILWEGRNAQGDPVAEGIHFARAATADGTGTVRLVTTR